MTKPNLLYKPLDIFSDEEIASILKSDKVNEIIILPLSVGMNHPNWKFAQDLCIQLYSHKDWRVKANSLRGLEYIAMTKGRLDKHLVRPILLNALKSPNWNDLDIISVTEAINKYLKWKIGTKAIERLRNH